MILASYESMRVNFAVRAYGATPARGPDGRLLFPTSVSAYPTSGMGLGGPATLSAVGIPEDASVLPLVVTVNDRSEDAVARADEWDWYLWHEAGWLELRRRPSDSFASTSSGSAWLYLTAAGLAAFPTDGITPSGAQRKVSIGALRRLLRATYVYAQHRGDGTVRIFDLSSLVFDTPPGPAPPPIS